MTSNIIIEAPSASTGTAGAVVPRALANYGCRHRHDWHQSATEAGFCSMQENPPAAPPPRPTWAARITRIAPGESGRIFEVRLQTPERRMEYLAIAESSAQCLFAALNLDLAAVLRAYELARTHGARVEG
jgi:hypothetical protein